MKKGSTLERQMLSYFGLIAAASLLITVEFVWVLQTAMSDLRVLPAPLAAAEEDSEK